MIREDFLHYLWKHKVFINEKLQTIDKVGLRILKQGEHNLNSGPDFFNAKIEIGNQLWAGNVEIHVKSSDWYLHQHERDENYHNVILHVVWENDIEIYHKNNTIIPTLELNSIVSRRILNQYQVLFSKPLRWINCENIIASIDNFTLHNWLEVLYLERLQQKSKLIQQLLLNSANDWEAVLFQLLTKNFGLKVNGDSFLNLARSIDFKIIRKEQNNLLSLEALLFGQAGFLQEELEEPYFKLLKTEYTFLRMKYQLEPLFKGQFQFFRLRPNNFPTIRLAQLASLYFLWNNLFSKIMNTESLHDFYALFDTNTSPFWKQHYSFTSNSRKRSIKISKSFTDLLLINTIIPLKFIYFKHIGLLQEESIINISKKIPSEKNNIIKKFKSFINNDRMQELKINNAFESQAFLQLKTAYCDKQRCLQCAIGNAILRK